MMLSYSHNFLFSQCIFKPSSSSSLHGPKGPVNIHWGVGTGAKGIGRILFLAKIIIELLTFPNLSTDRIVFFVCFLSR